MKKKECPSCAMDVNVNERICPVCGYEFPVQSKWQVAVAVLLLLAILAFMII